MTLEMFLEELCTAVENAAVKNNLNVDSARSKRLLCKNINKKEKSTCSCVNKNLQK